MSLLTALSSFARVLPAGVLSSLDFASLLDQQGRMLKIETALPTLALVPEKLVMNDAVNRPFELVVDCVSTSVGFELKQLVGEQVSVSLLQASGSYSQWHGYVTDAAQLGSDGGLARYRLHMKPWLAFLELRVDSFVYQDKTTREIVEEVFKDYTQANFRFELTPERTQAMRPRSLCSQFAETDLAFVTRLLAEDGLSYRFEHLEDDDESSAASDAEQAAQARHVMVIEDSGAVRPDFGDVRFTSTHATANLAGQKDAVNAFAASRVVAANAVTLGAWNYKHVAGTAASDESALDLGEAPRLEVYDGSGAYRYNDAAAASQATALALGALELGYKRFEGDGSVRGFIAGQTFSLVDHPLYGANTSAFNYAGALTASHQRPDNQFTLISVEHHATNNLGSQAAALLGITELEQGTYRNHFHAVPAAAPMLPRFVRKPTAASSATALVVGIVGEPITTDREHRVKVQFHWQRGEQPNLGGLAHAVPVGSAAADERGNAPGNEQSGTWVRVALPAAGANWGAAFTPRVGSEVSIGFVEGDIDRPVITGQLYNGVDAPPFSAGVDSGVNHPGVISGVHTERLDHGGYNQWVVDDASGQMRMRLLSDHSGAELGLGYLIQQSGSSAERGHWRGMGFEANTRGWVGVHAAKGLLVSTTTRAGTYGSAESTQMDAAEALAQLRSASQLGNAMSHVAASAGAQGFSAAADGKSLGKLIDSLDPAKEGKHAGDVGGQSAMKANGRETGTEPVEAFGTPAILFDTPSAFVMATEAGIACFAGEDLSVIAQSDVHHTAGHTWSAVSGKTSSWFTHTGGIKAFAANGPVSLRAHTDQLQVWADKEITVISVNDAITVTANSKIEFIAGQSSMTLEGANIEFKTPGAFTAKGAMKAFLGGASATAKGLALPAGQVKVPDFAMPVRDCDLEFRRVYADGMPIPNIPYEVTFGDGSKRKGTTDDTGLAIHRKVPDGEASVVYGLDPNPPKASVKMEVDDDFAQIFGAASSSKTLSLAKAPQPGADIGLAGDTPQAAGPCAGQGMSNAATENAFITGYKENVLADWPQMTLGERLARLKSVVNSTLSKHGVPTVNVLPTQDPTVSGSMSPKTWALSFEQATLESGTLGDGDAKELADTIFHESRHAEQSYTVARALAGDGVSADEISKKLGLPMTVSQGAVNDPMPTNDPRRACAGVIYDSVWGKGAADFSAVLNEHAQARSALDAAKDELDEATQRYEESRDFFEDREQAIAKVGLAEKRVHKALDAYKNLPAEADAWQAAARMMKRW